MRHSLSVSLQEFGRDAETDVSHSGMVVCVGTLKTLVVGLEKQLLSTMSKVQLKGLGRQDRRGAVWSQDD